MQTTPVGLERRVAPSSFAVFLGALFARGVPSCTDTTVPPIPPMGYNQQVCLLHQQPHPALHRDPQPGHPEHPGHAGFHNSTFELRPPAPAPANALNNCGHVILYRDGEQQPVGELPITDICS